MPPPSSLKAPLATDRRRHYTDPATATPTTFSGRENRTPLTSIAGYTSFFGYAHGPTRRNQDRSPASTSSGTSKFRTTQTSRTSRTTNQWQQLLVPINHSPGYTTTTCF